MLFIRQNIKMPISTLIFAMRNLHRRSWKQAAHLFGLEHTLDADGHGRCAMRNLVVSSAPDHIAEGVLENAKEFIGHFGLGPEEALQTLDPFEVGNDNAPGVVGPLAASARIRHLILPAFVSLITRSTAAGTSTSQGRMSNSFGST